MTTATAIIVIIIKLGPVTTAITIVNKESGMTGLKEMRNV